MTQSADHDVKSNVKTVKAGSQERKARADVISDPAHADTTGTDWTGEGGATEDGPANESN